MAPGIDYATDVRLEMLKSLPTAPVSADSQDEKEPGENHGSKMAAELTATADILSTSAQRLDTN